LDLDGTLIDSQPGILSSCQAALRTLGHDPGPLTNLENIIGPPIEDVMRYLLLPFGDTRVAEAVEAYRSDYGATGLFMGDLYQGIPEALRSIRDQGGRLFLATSKRATFARRILENLGLHDLFDGIYGSEPGMGIDHKPELIAYILAQNKLVADQCVMVGDRKFDIVGSQRLRSKYTGPRAE
jgi:phosphoglycolate phosphatase